MYESIYELPSQVKASLSHDDCQMWMNAYNEFDPKNETESRIAYRSAWKACRELPSSFAFDTIASTETIDKAKDLIDLDSIKKTFDPYIDYGGNIQLDHRNYTVGTIWDWDPVEVETEEGKVPGILAHGNLFGGDFVYDVVRKHFVDGMSSLSIGGEATHGNRICDDRGCYTKKDLKQLLEVSVCSEPMNKYTNLVWYNKTARLTKSVSAFEDGCPIMSLKRKLCDAGMDAHAKEDGVYVAMTKAEYEYMEPIFGDNDIVSCYHNGNAILGTSEFAERLVEAMNDKSGKKNDDKERSD